MELTQRHLVNRRLRLADAELVTKYVFPFWDGEWRIAFFLVDRLGRPPSRADSLSCTTTTRGGCSAGWEASRTR
ncbi:MAG: hypothetical protein E6K12_10900 [Methanobacteriota archaeon]|nr:MAG: hypothetical protein E6K12_10900 [Euryarchaeota archaeon]